jgi:hypothetical protein
MAIRILVGPANPSRLSRRLINTVLRGLYPPEIRIAIIGDNFSAHLTTR